MTINRYNIQGYEDRNACLSAFAHNGYRVWIEEERDIYISTTYYLCVEEVDNAKKTD